MTQSVFSQTHTDVHTRVQCRHDKTLTFPTSSSSPAPTFSPPLLPFSGVLVGELLGLISFSQLGLGLLILGGLSLALCSPHAKIEEGRGKMMIWHASHKLINTYNPRKGSTKADKHGRVYAHLNFHGCKLSRREEWVLKRKCCWLFLRPAVVGCLFCWSF